MTCVITELWRLGLLWTLLSLYEARWNAAKLPSGALQWLFAREEGLLYLRLGNKGRCKRRQSRSMQGIGTVFESCCVILRLAFIERAAGERRLGWSLAR